MASIPLLSSNQKAAAVRRRWEEARGTFESTETFQERQKLVARLSPDLKSVRDIGSF
jgi:hypothetical protein